MVINNSVIWKAEYRQFKFADGSRLMINFAPLKIILNY